MLAGLGGIVGITLQQQQQAQADELGSMEYYGNVDLQGSKVENKVFIYKPEGATAEASFAVPAVWKTKEEVEEPEARTRCWRDFTEPISGNKVFSNIEISASAVTAKSVEDFGRPESDKYMKLITASDKELQRADLMSIDVRVDGSGTKYWDYKLAYSPPKSECSFEEARKFWGECPIKTLAYVSTTVRDGVMYRFVARTTLDQWNQFAKQQPAVWKSFTVSA